MHGKRKILLVYPGLRPPGGGTAVAAWMLQALHHDHDVKAIVWDEPDFAGLDQHFGTSLRDARIEVRRPSPTWRKLLSGPGLNLMKHNVLLRMARKVADSFDVIIGAHSENDFGRPGIQYIHYPRFDDMLTRGQRALPPGHFSWYHHSSKMMRAYFAVAHGISGLTLDGVRRNVTLVNSRWTGEVTGRVLGVEPIVVYPPVLGDFPDVPWDERENAFVCIGRISREKRIPLMMNVVAELRQRGHDVSLKIVGARDDADHLEEIKVLGAKLGPFITFHIDLPRRELTSHVARCRYALHAMEDEHFGIAVAELAIAGCVVFVHKSGGQVEIVGDDVFPELSYVDAQDAVAKIERVLASEPKRLAIREHLRARGRLFSVERFVEEIRAQVARFPL